MSAKHAIKNGMQTANNIKIIPCGQAFYRLSAGDIVLLFFAEICGSEPFYIGGFKQDKSVIVHYEYNIRKAYQL